MRKVERAAHCDCSIYYKIYKLCRHEDTGTLSPYLRSKAFSSRVKAPDRHIRQALCSMWHGVRTTAVANPHKIRRCLCGELFVRIDLPDYSLRGFSLAVLQLGFGLVVIHYHSASNIPYASYVSSGPIGCSTMSQAAVSTSSTCIICIESCPFVGSVVSPWIPNGAFSKLCEDFISETFSTAAFSASSCQFA